jgi:outer membrane protein OmpA-like peptidoglycan-associated protein
MKLLILLPAVFLLMFSGVCAQSYTTEKTTSSKVQKQISDAKGLIMTNKTDDAVKVLQKALNEDENCIDIWQMLGEIYFIKENYNDCIKHIDYVLQLNPDYRSKNHYLMCSSFWHVDDYNNCIKAGDAYLKTQGQYDVWTKEVKRNIDNARFAAVAKLNPVPFDPINLGDNINTSNMDEYSPSISLDNSILIYNRNVANGNTHQEDFYISYLKDGVWSKAVDAGSPLNTPNNEGAQKLSADGNTLFFTLCNAKGGYGSCDIYTAQRTGDAWTNIRNLGFPISVTTWESQPSISADGKDLYFASNRPGTLGVRDIFVSHKGPDGKWGIPENLGDNINTAYDEGYPFIHPDNKTLYFCSDGWPGMGGIDIFVSKKDDKGNWTKPINLGYPINTKGDNTGLIVSADGKTAYYASTPDGRSDLDLYKFSIPETVRPTAVTYVKGVVKNKTDGKPLQAKIELIDLSTSKVVAELSSDANGLFFHSLPTGYNYAFNISKPGYLFYSENFELLKESDATNPFVLNIGLEPVTAGSSVVLRNVFFDVNASALKPESKTELDKLVLFLKTNATAKIEIGGHTDNTGTASANQQLSEARAKSVYNVLIQAGIEPSRLSFKGYGASKPIADNDTEQGRAQTRRTEVRITSM